MKCWNYTKLVQLPVESLSPPINILFHGSMLQEAYTSGMNDRTNHYRRILNMYMKFHEAVVAKHDA
ncbi:unnamed protein product [Eruca vesicaria subsp. sativa]|uniref:Uncharacterized protein n=1 Tax=Eruca vesicaria subsp. sativa TaxID=29727 RepID=A0ABC8KKI1_ERUVS|nr:unnamed protein product [Eruca vesicaria subsp. sativa]